jgi:hypothetical protein
MEHIAFIVTVDEKAKQEITRSRRQAELSTPPISVFFLFGLLLDPEDGGRVPPKRLSLS